MTIRHALTIDPSGEWSPVQARKVLEIIQPQAIEMGIYFNAIEVTTFVSKFRRMILVAHCFRHQLGVSIDNVCWRCVRDDPPRRR